jgi:hypothetical protein
VGVAEAVEDADAVAVADEVEDADEDALLLDEPEAVAEPVDVPLGVALLDEEPLVARGASRGPAGWCWTTWPTMTTSHWP